MSMKEPTQRLIHRAGGYSSVFTASRIILGDGIKPCRQHIWTPVAAGVLKIDPASMVLGVMVAGIMFITAASTLGWLLGTVVDGLRAKSHSLAEAKHKA